MSWEQDRQARYRIKRKLIRMSALVQEMSEIYERHPDLNDQINIAKVIPMSLDEWWREIQKVAESIVV